MSETHKYDFTIKVLYYGKGFSKFELMHNIIFELHDDSVVGSHVTAPAGMKTDGRSSPGFLKHFVPTFGKSARAYILHDFLYIYDVGVKEIGKRRARAWADREMYEMAKKLNPGKWYQLPFWENLLSYYAVRLFGGFVYKRNLDDGH